MSEISVKVIKTEAFITPGGCERAIPGNSKALRMEDVQLVGDARKGFVDYNFPWKACLKIYVPGDGYMWIDSTLAAFNTMLGQSTNSADRVKLIEKTITTHSMTYVDPLLYNATILRITLDGATLSLLSIPYTQTTNPNVGVLDFTALGGLYPTSYLEVEYRNN